MRHLIIAALLLSCAGTQKPASGPETFHARLEVASEIPPPNVGPATPSGTATFTSSGGSIAYEVQVTGLASGFTAAHIHGGAEGALGLVVVPLALTAGPDGTAGGAGVIEASSIKGTNPDASQMTINDLLAAMRSGGCYVNIHTSGNPKGEIRGQVRP